jgi:voltage-gated potassium channel
MKKFIINAESRLLIFWDIIILIASLYIAIEIPLVIVFKIEEDLFFRILNWFITSIYIFDIVLSFNTSVYVKGKEITDRLYIAKRYLKSWFIIDLLAAFPFSSLLISMKHMEALSKLLKLFRLGRLLKLIRITGTIQKSASSRINPAILRLLILVAWIMIIAHFISCSWIYLSEPAPGIDPVSQYIRAFYWTITTLTTIGYGDILPVGNVQTVFVIVIEFMGAAMYGLIIGNIANLIANIDIAKTKFKEKMKTINTFLNYRNIPNDMKKKVNSYYYYLWDSRHGYNETEIMNDLPLQLKESISLHLNKDIIAKVPLFTGASEEFIKEIIFNLESVVFTPGDYIVKAGEVGDDMYFIGSGAVDVLSADGKQHFATLTEGQFFGEIALLLRTPRTATIKAREYSDFYRLKKETFESILKKYPEFEKTIRKMAEARQIETEAIKESEKGYLRKIKNIEVKRIKYGINLKWNKIPEAVYYEIVKREDTAKNWEYVVKRLMMPQFIDIKIENVKKLYYKIRAIYKSGPGSWSDEYSIDTTTKIE